MAPNSTGSATKSCPVMGDVHLLYAHSHMHQHGVEFTATDVSTGTQLYHTTNWDDPPLEELQPAIDLHDGDQIEWTCNYNNTTGQTLNIRPVGRDQRDVHPPRPVLPGRQRRQPDDGLFLLATREPTRRLHASRRTAARPAAQPVFWLGFFFGLR